MGRPCVVASATHVISTGLDYFLLKVPHACRSGGWRSSVTSWVRASATDPWTRLKPSPFNSGIRRVRLWS